MKRVLIAAALALAAAAPALAADLPPPPPVAPVPYIPPRPIYLWTGFYIGLNGGGGLGASTWQTPLVTSNSFTVNGALFGGTIGGNYQIGEFVVGAEGDYDWQNLRGSQTNGVCALTGCNTSSNWLATFRGRVGYAPQQFLYYVTGGGAATNVRASLGATPWSGSTEMGWTVGGGLEYAFVDHWTMKVEYLFADFQKATCSTASCGPAGVTVSLHENIIRGGVNYKF